MTPAPPLTSGEITSLLQQWTSGDPNALSHVLTLAYRELKNIARRAFASYGGGNGGGKTLQPTALINEAYLKLLESKDIHFENRLQFFSFAGFLMRRILIQHARERMAQKRQPNGPVIAIQLDEVIASSQCKDLDPNMIIRLDQILEELEQIDLRKFRIVILRFFAGMTVEEAATVLALSTRTIKREWKTAKRWLAVRLSE